MTQTKTIKFGLEAREAIVKGVNTVCDAVKVTLGAAGRNVVISYPFGQMVTKDGVSVAKSIFLSDPIEKAGAEIIKEVATRMLTEVGDATTTACVLAQAIIDEGMQLVNAGTNPVELKKGIDAAAKEIVDKLQEMAIPCDNDERRLQVATVSANHDAELGQLIADAYGKVGGDGVVLIEDSVNRNTSIKLIDGLQFDKGYGMAEFFVTNPQKMVSELKDAHVLIYDGSITTMKEIDPVLRMVLGKPGGQLLIIANGIENEAYSFLAINRAQQPEMFKVCMVEAPGFGTDRTEILEDIAVMVNGQVVSEAKGFKLETLPYETLGRVNRVTVSKTSTTLVGGAGTKEQVDARVEQLKVLLADTADENIKGFLRRRIAKLNGAVAILSVGASSEVELREKKDRCDDAIRAVKSAIEEGIIAGGGTAFMKIHKDDLLNRSAIAANDFEKGQELIYDIVAAPFVTIIENAGKQPSEISSNPDFLQGNNGYDVKKEQVIDMIEAGIIDPVKAARCALEFAAGIGGLLLTTEALCINIDTPNQR